MEFPPSFLLIYEGQDMTDEMRYMAAVVAWLKKEYPNLFDLVTKHANDEIKQCTVPAEVHPDDKDTYLIGRYNGTMSVLTIAVCRKAGVRIPSAEELGLK